MKNLAANLLYSTGALRAIDRLLGPRLTVLCYHRIAEVDNPRFAGYRPNVSASARQFSDQMSYIAGRYNVVSLEQLAAWLQGARGLPPRAVLITFDDGYRDNYATAFPILRRFGLAATIFLTTDYVGGQRPFYWDLAAECFRATDRSRADLPELGARGWRGDGERHAILNEWIRAVKVLPDQLRIAAVTELPRSLGVADGIDRFSGDMLTWDEVRSMAKSGMGFGSHSCSHAILARLPLDAAVAELRRSKARIEEEIETPVTGFAYPNGQPGDYTDQHATALKDCGYTSAFTLSPGPASIGEVQDRPFTIRRIAVDAGDALPRFAAKLVGERRMAHRVRRQIGRE